MEENYLSKWLNNEMTDAELEKFKAQPCYDLYEKIKAYSSELQTTSLNENRILNTILSAKKVTPKVISFQQSWIFRIAAILVLGFGLSFTYQNFTYTNQFTGNGKHTTFLLPDESQVHLNSGSEIEYKKWNWENNRQLNLTGEAYFKVAKGKSFEVSTALGKVTVLGTQFNVKARKKRFDITCYEGKVKVNYNTNEVILTKGMTVSFENNIKIIDRNSNDEKPTWTSMEMEFEKEKLSNVIEEIQRQYNITISVSKIETEQLFTGKIPSNNIDVALEIISSIYHLEINKTSLTSYSMIKTK